MERPADQIIDLYRRHGRAWARLRGHTGMENAWLLRFIAALGDAPLVLDLGCGAGAPIGTFLAQEGAQICGVDSSPDLLALAGMNLPAAELIEADMRRLDLGARFDGVIAWNSFFHLSPEDQREMLGVMAAHCKPKAAILFTAGPEAGEVLGKLEGEPLYHASLDVVEYQAILDEHGFRLIAHRLEDPDCGGHSVFLAARN